MENRSISMYNFILVLLAKEKLVEVVCTKITGGLSIVPNVRLNRL